MNAERLLAHYERIADAPDAIARLRRFILDLAVRGKLVPQDPNDEPASELLKRIAKEKARLVKAGEIRKESCHHGDQMPPSNFRRSGNGRVSATSLDISATEKVPTKYAVSDGSLVISQKCVQWKVSISRSQADHFGSARRYEAIRFLRVGDLLWNSIGTGTIER